MARFRVLNIFLVFVLLHPPCNSQDVYVLERRRMVDEQLVARGITNRRVLTAMKEVPRHLFVPREAESLAYGDRPLPIGYGQTISQPYIVAVMTELLNPRPGMKILEIGTGSGYQAAVLAETGCEVFTIEIVDSLGSISSRLLKSLGYGNIHTRIGDGYAGWEEYAPYDGIIVTCAPTRVPDLLREQLKDGGRMVIPVGGRPFQELVLLKKNGDKMITENVLPVLFVPMVRPDGRKY